MNPDLGTTNLWLGVIAAVSVLQALIVIGAAVAVFMVYRRVMALVIRLEEHQVAPAMATVHAILADVKGVSAKVKQETERMDHAIRTTISRVDDTADRVRSNVKARTSRLVGFVRGARVALETILQNGSRAA